MEYLVFFSIVAAVGGLIWYLTDKFLKNEAAMVAESTKKELHKFKEEVAAVTNAVEKKTKEVVAEVRVVKTRKRVKK
jgi:2-hydroxy-3-keto-5-methylthiopentenyl-1-phosphate phosphatase